MDIKNLTQGPKLLPITVGKDASGAMFRPRFLRIDPGQTVAAPDDIDLNHPVVKAWEQARDIEITGDRPEAKGDAPLTDDEIRERQEKFTPAVGRGRRPDPQKPSE